MVDRIRSIYLALRSTLEASWLPLTVGLTAIGLLFGLTPEA